MSPEDSILLQKNDENSKDLGYMMSDGYSLSVNRDTEKRVPSDEWESSEEICAEISVQRIAEGLGRNMHSYRLGSDGVVRRYDIGDACAKVQQNKELGIGAAGLDGFGNLTRDELASSLENAINETVSAIPNNRLDKKMGLNDQPIFIDEMDALAEFVRQPGFEPYKI